MSEQFQQLIENRLKAAATISAGTLTTAFSGVLYYYGRVCRVLGGG